MAPFKSFSTVSYSHSLVTMAVLYNFEIKRDIGRKSQFVIPLALCAPVKLWSQVRYDCDPTTTQGYDKKMTC